MTTDSNGLDELRSYAPTELTFLHWWAFWACVNYQYCL
jgi:hypothetical protein